VPKTERVKIAVEVKGLDDITRAFRGLSKEANNALRDASNRAVTRITPFLIAGMASDSAQGRLVASTIRPVRDRIPALAGGGAKAVAPSSGRKRKRPKSGDIFFGAEFGGQGRPTTRQFKPHSGTTGYGFYPAFRAHMSTMFDAYYDELNRLCADWEH